MRILLVGDGGREHALAWRLDRSPSLTALAVTHRKPAWPDRAELLDVTDVDGIARAAEAWGADLVVVGPEAPLAEGLADRLTTPCFGPSAAAARLESSKAFAKEVMAAAGVPTADAVVVDASDPAAARARADRGQVVVKVDGLAAGKGVFVCPTATEAHAALDEVLGERFGAAAGRIVLEDLLVGHEVSVFALSDGERVVPLLCTRDHKREGDGDTGENTGGMGAIAPVPGIDDATVGAWVDAIHAPVVREMAARGTPFVGVLFAGIMVTADGPKVLEFNVRFGDPECQVLMPLWEDDPVPWLAGAANGALPPGVPRFTDAHACCVVMASAGYPRSSTKGSPIPEPPGARDGVVAFHAGTARSPDGGLVTAGGRVLGVTGIGPTAAIARQRAYTEVDRLRFPGCRIRTDIGGSPQAPDLDGWTADRPAPGIVVYQPARGFRYSADAFWLAGFALEGGVPDLALDLCTGSGIVGFLLARHGVEVVGLDVNPSWEPGWRASCAASDVAPVFWRMDVTALDATAEFDLVTVNPPYAPRGAGPAPADRWKAIAHEESTATLRDVLAAGAQALRPGGRLVTIVPDDRSDEAVAAGRRCGLALVRRAVVGPRALLELRPLPTLVDDAVLEREGARVGGWFPVRS